MPSGAVFKNEKDPNPKSEMVRQAHHPERPVVKANFNNRQSKGNIK
jgi:hypothetical protein